MKIAQVIPILRLPSHTESVFDYLVPEKMQAGIKLGHVVSIPFRGSRTVQGVVVALKMRAGKGLKGKVKEISVMEFTEPLVTEHQIKLAKDLSRLASVSLALAMKTIVPDVPKRKTQYKMTDVPRHGESGVSEKKDKDLQEDSMRKILIEKKPLLLQYASIGQRDEFIESLAGSCAQISKQLLVVVPEIADVLMLHDAEIAHMASYVHSRLTQKEFFKDWLAILTGESEIIIGTKRALFMPFKHLGAIVIDQEHSQSLDNAEQKPFYRAMDLAEFLAKQFKCPLVLASYAPKVKTWEKAKYGVYKKIEEPTPPRHPMSGRPSEEGTINPLLPARQSLDGGGRGVEGCVISLVDMNEEIRKENFSALSEKLNEAIRSFLSPFEGEIQRGISRNNIFLFLNRRGYSTIIICKDCGYVFECPNCGKPLVNHLFAATSYTLHATSLLKCHSCGHKEDMPPLCPKCGNAEFKFAGKGTQKIEALLKKEFPGVEVVRMDSDKKYGLPELSSIIGHSDHDESGEESRPLASLKPRLAVALAKRVRRSGRGRTITRYARSFANAQDDKISDIVPKKLTIFIGTEYALSRLPWATIGLVGVLNVDAMLSIPDPRAHERVYQLIRRMQTYMTYKTYTTNKSNKYSKTYMTYETYKTNKSNPPEILTPQPTPLNPHLLIQTHAPALPIFRSLVENNSDIFYESELEMRKK